MAGEEAVQITATAAQKAMEILVELLKTIVIPALQKTGSAAKTGLGMATSIISDKVSEKTKTGNIPRKEMLNEAVKSESAILSSENLFAEDVGKIAARAKQEGIPMHIIGEGGKQTIEFLERDKAVMQTIMQETIANNIKSNPSEYAQFALNDSNVLPMKSLLEKNGVQCCFFNANGKTYCSYHAYDAEKVEMLKQDFKDMRNDIAADLKAERSKDRLGTITDVKLNKSVDLSQFGGNVRQYQVVKMLQNEFGYSKEKATLAANKVCDDLGLDPKEFFAHTEQLDAIKSFKTNIRFESDDILLRDVAFSEVYFKDGESPHISLTNGDKSVTITPDKMTESELKEVCVAQLSMSDSQADKAVKKTMKINDRIKSEQKELTVDHATGISQSVEIERTSDNSFTLTIGKTKKQYNLNDEKLADKLKGDLGISSEKAERIIGKAKKQNGFVNNIDKKMSRKPEKAPKQNVHTEKPQSKGARK